MADSYAFYGHATGNASDGSVSFDAEDGRTLRLTGLVEIDSGTYRCLGSDGKRYIFEDGEERASLYADRSSPTV